jgi:hypothetical protein
MPVEDAGSARFPRCAPVRTFIRQRRSGVKSLFPEATEIGRVRNGGLRAAVRLCNVEWGWHKNVSEKLLDSGTALFISQRRKPTKISTGDESVPAFRPYKNRRSRRIVLKKGASLLVNLERIPKRFPCLIVGSSPEGFRLIGTFRLRRGQVVEIIPDEDPLNVSRCHVIWIGKPGSKQEGQVGLQLLNPNVNPRGT